MPTWSMVVKSSAGRPVRGSVVTAASSRKTSETTGAGATQSHGPAVHSGATDPRVGQQAWLQEPAAGSVPGPLASLWSRRAPAGGGPSTRGGQDGSFDGWGQSGPRSARQEGDRCVVELLGVRAVDAVRATLDEDQFAA